ncbi:MAG: hypothetical protein UIH27_12610 [Ruminococcus sp.]|nr:hypothetical protein [Ruminococcus sp.]
MFGELFDYNPAFEKTKSLQFKEGFDVKQQYITGTTCRGLHCKPALPTLVPVRLSIENILTSGDEQRAFSREKALVRRQRVFSCLSVDRSKTLCSTAQFRKNNEHFSRNSDVTYHAAP